MSAFAFLPVTVTHIDLATGKTDQTTSIFFCEKQANRFMVEEMKWESTVRVACLPLGVDVPGDFAGVTHSFA
jgi:hypothetical protein